MKRTYLLLSIIGFVLPNIWVAKISIQSGNFLLWWNIKSTFGDMFANDVSTAFAVDLLWVVVVFFTWSYYQAKKFNIKQLYMVWVFTMLFGLAGGFPLFLYLKEIQVEQSNLADPSSIP